jgi:hypothetical protein
MSAAISFSERGMSRLTLFASFRNRTHRGTKSLASSTVDATYEFVLESLGGPRRDYAGADLDRAHMHVTKIDVPAFLGRIGRSAAGEFGHAPLKRGLSRRANCFIGRLEW